MTRARWFVRALSGLLLMAGLTAGAQTQSPPASPSPAAPAPDSPAPPSDDHPALPAGPGRDLVIRVCSPCHQPEKVADQMLDQAGWKMLVDGMAAQGATATNEEFDQIVSYLAKAFPATK